MPKAATRSRRTVRPAPTPRRQARGLRTREAILERAVDLASVEGLAGLTLGRLAEALHMSKSGLFAHFGSKEELQLATVGAARQIFIDRIMQPAFTAPKGMPRLWMLIDSWIAHVEQRVFEGGCFFTAASFEFDSRHGRVRDCIAAIMSEWISVLARSVREAQKVGHVTAKIDPARLAHEINALGMGAHWAYQLLDERHAYRRTRSIILDKLRIIATPQSPPLPKPSR